MRDNDPSEETFIITPEVSRILTSYGQEIEALIDRKYTVETLVYNILNNFDKNDKTEMDEGYTLGDKFVLNTLYCDSKLANKVNDNLINLLRQNDTIESVIQHRTNIDVKERFKEQKELAELIDMCNDLEKVNDNLEEFINSLEEREIEKSNPLDFISFSHSNNYSNLLIDDFEDDEDEKM